MGTSAEPGLIATSAAPALADRASAGSARGQSLFALAGRELLRTPGSVAGLVLIGAIVLAAVLAPVVAPYDPVATATAESAMAPSVQHWFGTDVLGRDMFSRVIYGARISLWLGLISVSIACVCGLLFGITAGYYGGWVDTVIMRGADMLLAFPSFLLALTIVFALGQSLINVMIAVGISSIPGYTRIVRGSVLSAREHEYVDRRAYHRLHGRRDLMTRHILPNVVAPVIVISTVGIAWAIIAAAVPLLPRDGRAAADAGVGSHGQRWPALPARVLVDLHLSRPGDHGNGAGDQPGRRWPARCARSPIAACLLGQYGRTRPSGRSKERPWG